VAAVHVVSSSWAKPLAAQGYQLTSKIWPFQGAKGNSQLGKIKASRKREGVYHERTAQVF
jgi:hypothetical protein